MHNTSRANFDNLCFVIILNTQAGCTPFYLASSKGRVAVVRLLIMMNADVNIRNKVLLPSLLEDYLIIY